MIEKRCPNVMITGSTLYPTPKSATDELYERVQRSMNILRKKNLSNSLIIIQNKSCATNAEKSLNFFCVSLPSVIHNHE